MSNGVLTTGDALGPPPEFVPPVPAELPAAELPPPPT
jgi:hypothetical protein